MRRYTCGSTVGDKAIPPAYRLPKLEPFSPAIHRTGSHVPPICRTDFLAHPPSPCRVNIFPESDDVPLAVLLDNSILTRSTRHRFPCPPLWCRWTDDPGRRGYLGMGLASQYGIRARPPSMLALPIVERPATPITANNDRLRDGRRVFHRFSVLRFAHRSAAWHRVAEVQRRTESFCYARRLSGLRTAGELAPVTVSGRTGGDLVRMCDECTPIARLAIS